FLSTGIARIDSQCLLQRIAAFLEIIECGSQPHPGHFIVLVLLNHLAQQTLGIEFVSAAGGFDSLSESFLAGVIASQKIPPQSEITWVWCSPLYIKIVEWEKHPASAPFVLYRNFAKCVTIIGEIKL